MKNTWSTECLRTIQFLYIKIYTDPTRLERCLRNLLENALKYSDDDVKITVVLSEHDNHLSIAIQDTGWGIPQKAQKKLGKQFYRVQIEGKKVHPDHGLGLCSVKQLVKEMDGSVTFRSTEGFGSIFIITLPWKLQHHYFRVDTKNLIWVFLFQIRFRGSSAWRLTSSSWWPSL